MFTEPGTARQEAERLVAVILAAATMAANANPHLSTGSPECCVCPLCKVIAAVRDPDPAVVERIATGAGDLAVGLASFLRNVSGGASPHTSEDVWKAATTDEPAPPVKKVAKKALKKAQPLAETPATARPVKKVVAETPGPAKTPVKKKKASPQS